MKYFHGGALVRAAFRVFQLLLLLYCPRDVYCVRNRFLETSSSRIADQSAFLLHNTLDNGYQFNQLHGEDIRKLKHVFSTGRTSSSPDSQVITKASTHLFQRSWPCTLAGAFRLGAQSLHSYVAEKSGPMFWINEDYAAGSDEETRVKIAMDLSEKMRTTRVSEGTPTHGGMIPKKLQSLGRSLLSKRTPWPPHSGSPNPIHNKKKLREVTTRETRSPRCSGTSCSILHKDVATLVGSEQIGGIAFPKAKARHLHNLKMHKLVLNSLAKGSSSPGSGSPSNGHNSMGT